MPVQTPEISLPNRMGCQYYPDSQHYTHRDLATWLPELRRLGVGWLALNAPDRRAIPEYFITSLLDAGIQPILRFGLSLKEPVAEGFDLLYESYARWGVHYVDLFASPNLRSTWPASGWAHTELVERFLDRFLPLAERACQAGLTPLFPCLEPGGDYWDLAFLQQGLAGVQRRAPTLARSLALAAQVSLDHPLAWGAGGPERWPAARPYSTPPGSQDHRGFRIFEWYTALAQARFGFTPPVFLFAGRTGTAPAARSMFAARLLNGLPAEEDGQPLEPVSATVAAGCLWLLAAQAGSPQAAEALFSPGSEPHPVVEGLRELGALSDLSNSTEWTDHGEWVDLSEWAGGRETANIHEQVSVLKTACVLETGAGREQPAPSPVSLPKTAPVSPSSEPGLPRSQAAPGAGGRPIAHYLLLPTYDWGVDEVTFNSLLPFIRQHRPTLGFSLAEARLAQRVSIAGGINAYPAEAMFLLQEAGCRVERLLPDGTIIA